MSAAEAVPSLGTARLAMLNGMADPDIERSLAVQRGWGIVDLDLKDALWGRPLLELDDAQARRLARLADDAGMRVHCLSSPLFGGVLERGEEHFRQHHLRPIARLIELAAILRPRLVRLLAPESATTAPPGERMATAEREHPWLVPMYAQAIAQLHGAGLAATIENEVGGCVLAAPADVRRLFASLARAGAGRDRCCYTWDVQNLWQCGSWPSLAVYDELRDLIGYVHLKGGRCDRPGGPLRWRSGLGEAGWPIAEIVARVVADRTSPVICLNPSHGAPPPDGDRGGVADDISWLRGAIAGVA